MNEEIKEINFPRIKEIKGIVFTQKNITGIVYKENDIETNIYNDEQKEFLSFKLFPVIGLNNENSSVIIFTQKGEFELARKDIDLETQPLLDKLWNIGKLFLKDNQAEQLLNFVNENLKK